MVHTVFFGFNIKKTITVSSLHHLLLLPSTTPVLTNPSILNCPIIHSPTMMRNSWRSLISILLFCLSCTLLTADVNTDIHALLNVETDITQSSTDHGFLSGTLVSTEFGFQPIESLKVGERVFAFNFTSGSVELSDVVAVIQSERIAPAFQLKLASNETLAVGSEQPCFILSKGWVRVNEIEIDDIIQSAVHQDGVSIRDISSISSSSHPSLLHALEIKDLHNFFVGVEQ